MCVSFGDKFIDSTKNKAIIGVTVWCVGPTLQWSPSCGNLSERIVESLKANPFQRNRCILLSLEEHKSRGYVTILLKDQETWLTIGQDNQERTYLRAGFRSIRSSEPDCQPDWQMSCTSTEQGFTCELLSAYYGDVFFLFWLLASVSLISE